MFEVKVPYVIDHFHAAEQYLGVALKHYITFQITFVSQSTHENKWVAKGFQAVYGKMEMPCPAIDVIVKACDFHKQEGIAYEAACILAGACVANKALQEPFHKYDIFAIATAIHPALSCMASILFGSLTSCFMHDGKPNMIRYLVQQDYCFGILTPKQDAALILEDKDPNAYDAGKSASIPKALEIGNSVILHRACHTALCQDAKVEMAKPYEHVWTQNACACFYQSDRKSINAIIENEWKGFVFAKSMKEYNNEWDVAICEVDRKGIQIEVK